MVDPAFLSRISLFASLAPSELAELAGHVHERRYQRGAIVFGEGEPGDAAYFVREGRIKIFRLAADGSEQIMGIFGPGQPFGLVTVLDGAPYPASAQATEESLVWMIRSDQLQRVMRQHPNLTTGIFREVGDRLRQAQGRVHSLAVRSIHQRLAEYLLELAAIQGKSGQTGLIRVYLTMTHQELGSYLGASRETVTRAMADLRRDGAVTASAGDAIVLDPPKLHALMQG